MLKLIIIKRLRVSLHCKDMSENLKRHYEPHLLNLVVSSDKNLTKINKFVPLPVESNPAQRVDWKERSWKRGSGQIR